MPRYIDAGKLQTDMMEMVASGLYGPEDMIDAVIEAPTVSPDEVRGVAFWVDTQPHLDDSSYKKDGMAYYCSNCHHRAGKYKHRSYKFCPWCGAKIVPKEMAVRNED